MKPTATTAEKIMFIHQKLNMAKFGKAPEEYGINEMKRSGIIQTAYPLHDTDIQEPKAEFISDRQVSSKK